MIRLYAWRIAVDDFFFVLFFLYCSRVEFRRGWILDTSTARNVALSKATRLFPFRRQVTVSWNNVATEWRKIGVSDLVRVSEPWWLWFGKRTVSRHCRRCCSVFEQFCHDHWVSFNGTTVTNTSLCMIVYFTTTIYFPFFYYYDRWRKISPISDKHFNQLLSARSRIPLERKKVERFSERSNQSPVSG